MPGYIMERPKISRARWEVLKAYIMKQREKQKQEQEADAEEERRRRERERQRKESAMSIEETKDELQRQEQRLAQLKDEKHQLFLQLKKVLNEEVTQRRLQSAKEQQNSDMPPIQATYLGTGGDMMIPPVSAPGPGPFMSQIQQTSYKIDNLAQPSHHLMPLAANMMKRPAPSPSPPPPAPTMPPQQPTLLGLGQHTLVTPGYVTQPVPQKAAVRVTAPVPKQPLPPPPQSQPYNFKSQTLPVYAAPTRTMETGRSAFVPSGGPFYHPSSSVTIQSSQAPSPSQMMVPAVSLPNAPPRSTAAGSVMAHGAIYSYPTTVSSPYEVPSGGPPQRKHLYTIPSSQGSQPPHSSAIPSPVVSVSAGPQRGQPPVVRRNLSTSAPSPVISTAPSSSPSTAAAARVSYPSPGPGSMIMRPTATMPVVSHHQSIPQQQVPPPPHSSQQQMSAAPKPYGIRPGTPMQQTPVVSSSFQPPQPMPTRPVYAGQGQPARIHFPPSHPTAVSSREPAAPTTPVTSSFNPWSWNYPNHLNGVAMMMQYNAYYQQQQQQHLQTPQQQPTPPLHQPPQLQPQPQQVLPQTQIQHHHQEQQHQLHHHQLRHFSLSDQRVLSRPTFRPSYMPRWPGPN